MKVLYLTDLDGTLLRSDQTISGFSRAVIKRVIQAGEFFSYATARSWYTARKVTAGLPAAIPVILYNGAFIRNNSTGKYLSQCFFERQAALDIASELFESGVSPIVYSVVGGAEKFSYMPDAINSATADFVATRRGDPRERPVSSREELLAGRIFYFSCIDAPEKLAPTYEHNRGLHNCVYQRDIYSGEQWLELMPRGASKAEAAQRLADVLECDSIVAFGDSINDIDLFRIADAAYAVENAAPELKALATGVIQSNDDDGVAKWLDKRFML